MLLQAVNHLGTFFLPALGYWYFIERRTWGQFNARPVSAVAGFGLVAFIVIAFMPFDGLVIEWNQNLHLPETLAPIEQWIRAKEKGLEGITRYLTTFNTVGQFLVAMVVIAVIPAIGEEALFRGILQRNVSIWTGNVHVGIWVSAVLFSAIHVQFLGFFHECYSVHCSAICTYGREIYGFLCWPTSLIMGLRYSWCTCINRK